VATSGYILRMYISIKEAKDQFSQILNRAEAGEKVVLTRHGRPIVELVPHRPKPGGINWEALAAFKKKHGVDRIVTYIAPDFDDPLPEDFLITPTTDPA
jgi:prevent-host-death family protein